MSTLAFAAMTNSRDAADPGTSDKPDGKPGLKTYIDSLAALVPAEVLALHAAILTFTTDTKKGMDGDIVTFTDRGVLKGAFWALIGLSMFLYLIGRVGSIGGSKAKLDWWDALRILIPPLAFVGWTMIQTNTAFDALGIDWSVALRDLIAVVGAVALGAIAVALAYKADAKT